MGGFNNRMEGRGGKISKLEDRIIEITQSEKQKEDRLGKMDQSLRGLWDCDKTSNTHVIGVPEGEEKEEGMKKNSKK